MNPKEEKTMTNTTNTTKNATTNTQPQTESKKTSNEAKKAAVQVALDKWLATFKATAEKAGQTVVIKTWENIPTCRSLKVDGVTYFEMYYSANGVRLNAKSKLIPESIRPAGSNIISNGLDLTIPTFSELEPNLKKYADACAASLAALKADKEKKAKEKADAKAKATAEKASKKTKEAPKAEEKKEPAKEKPQTQRGNKSKK